MAEISGATSDSTDGTTTHPPHNSAAISRDHRPLRITAQLAALICAAALAACAGVRSPDTATAARFAPLPEWSEPGTLVMFMPETVARAREASGDPTYAQWSATLIEYAATSELITRWHYQPRHLSRNVTLSSTTIPSSDYSILLVGPRKRGAHVFSPLIQPNDLAAIETWLLGSPAPNPWPNGSEPLRLMEAEMEPEEETEETPDESTPAS